MQNHIRLAAFVAIVAILPICSFAQKADRLPPFEFKGLNGQALTLDSLPKNKTVFILYFSPDCDHCNKEASIIRDQLPLFDNAVLLWINAFHEIPEIAAFSDKYFAGVNNVFFAKDQDYRFDAYFGESQVPTIYVYGSDGNYITVFKGENGVFHEPTAAELAQHIR